MRPRNHRAVVGYILAGVAMLILLLYLRFPGGAVTETIRAAASRYPGLLLSIDMVQPAIPPGVTLKNVTAGFRGRPEATLHADRLGIRPGWLSLLRGRLALVMAAEGYGGDIRGQVEFANIFSVKGPLSAEMNIRQIRIEKCAWLRDVLARQITGTLKGSAAFSGAAESLKNGTGNIDLTLTNGSYQLLENLLGFERIDFNKVDAKVSFRNGALKIAGLTLSGEKIRISLKGNILLADDFRESQIDLNGAIEIPMQGNKRVTLAISGTLGNPKTKFL
ncbi:MAG: type II secretion system protein GspN [Syntrophobacterales bacterium CG_4_8_14_3_um_filter_58_8]|nr:MAG: type II secretion system protein GspN [Syntrophobacterales bacterium CG_4_8_14_3_um_filter_58_8]